MVGRVIVVDQAGRPISDNPAAQLRKGGTP